MSPHPEPVLQTLLVICSLAAACAVARAADLVLVDNGTPKSMIVAADNLSPSEAWAVEEFQRFVKEMSGAEVPRFTPEKVPAGDRRVHILIGHETVKARHPEIKLDDLGKEGYLIKTAGAELLVAGGKLRGTMYGVFTLLERFGCRWWTPTESFIPRKKTLAVPPIDLRDVAVVEYRDMLYNERYLPEFKAWCARNKINGMGWRDTEEKYGGRFFFRPRSLVHSYRELLDASKMEIKPEMWALRGGQRTKSQPCLTNPDVAVALTQGVLNLYREYPHTEFVAVGQQDNNNYCQCEACADLGKREGSMAGPAIALANRIAEAVEKEIPHARILAPAYSWTRPPPKTIRPRHNVMIIFCPLSSSFAHPIVDGSTEQNRELKQYFEGWSRIADSMLIWHYSGNRGHYLMPHPDLDSLVANIKYFVKGKARGIFVQGTHNGRSTDLVQLHMWLIARLLWNPEADGKALITEFVKGYYGSAGPAILRYIDLIHEPARKGTFHLGRRSQMHLPFVTPEIIANAEEILREAERLAQGDPVTMKRVRHVHMGVWYVLMKRGPHSATWKAVEKRVGRLDVEQVAANLAGVIKQWGVNTVADYEPVGPFLEWLKDYPDFIKKKGQVLPPELQEKDPATFRVIQARQLDSGMLKSAWWKRMEGAADGWVLACPSARWYVQHVFSPYDECAGAKRFKLFIRVRGGEASGREGAAFVCGAGSDRIEVSADQLADGKFHAFEVGELDAADRMRMYIALTRPSAVKEVYLDCLWLQPVGGHAE